MSGSPRLLYLLIISLFRRMAVLIASGGRGSSRAKPELDRCLLLPQEDSAGIFQWGALLSLFCLLFPTSIANAQATISSLQPASCQPGVTTKLTLHGSKLPNTLRVLTNRTDAKVEIESVVADRAIVAIVMSGDAKFGPLSLWFASPTGPLPTKIVMVDDLQTVLDNGNNHSVATAQPVSTLGAVDGVSE
ncbi:MAG TPA: hypothetical protein VM260_02430, partial [Pirellula sp.]|nr:hypothetical protein [Pirellula sp.]